MAEQTEALRDRQRRDATAIRLAKIGVLIAGFAAMVIVFDLFGLGRLALVLTVGGAVLALPFGIGERWYYLVAGGAIGGVIAFFLSDAHQTMGGLLAVVSASAIVIGASLGYPADE